MPFLFFLLGHLIYVHLHSLWWFHFVFNPLHASCQADRKRQIWIGRRVRVPWFTPCPPYPLGAGIGSMGSQFIRPRRCGSALHSGQTVYVESPAGFVRGVIACDMGHDSSNKMISVLASVQAHRPDHRKYSCHPSSTDILICIGPADPHLRFPA